MTLSSRHRIRNSSPGGLRPSTLPLGHGGSPQYWIIGPRSIIFRTPSTAAFWMATITYSVSCRPKESAIKGFRPSPPPLLPQKNWCPSLWSCPPFIPTIAPIPPPPYLYPVDLPLMWRTVDPDIDFSLTRGLAEIVLFPWEIKPNEKQEKNYWSML